MFLKSKIKIAIVSTLAMIYCLYPIPTYGGHARRNEICRSSTHTLEYNWNYASGVVDSLKLVGASTGEIKVSPLVSAHGQIVGAEFDGVDANYQVIRIAPTGVDLKNDDGCQLSVRRRYQKTIMFLGVNSLVMARTGITNFQRMTFNCEETTTVPSEHSTSPENKCAE